MNNENQPYLIEAINGRNATGDVVSATTDDMVVQFKFGRLKSIFNRNIKAASLRIVKNGHIGFSFGTDIARIEDMVDQAVYNAGFGPVAAFKFPTKNPCIPVKTYDGYVDEYEMEKAVEMGELAISLVNRAIPDAECDINIYKRKLLFELANTSGFMGSYVRTRISLGISVRLCGENDILNISNNQSLGIGIPNPGESIDKIINFYERAKSIASTTSKGMPIIFSAEVMPFLWKCLIFALNGQSVMLGISSLSDKLGEQAFDKRINIRDVPDIDHAVASAPFDDEGVNRYPMPLVNNGIIMNFTYDLQTAGLMGVSSNGRAVREIHSMPIPGTTNVVIEPGDISLENIIESLKEGIIVYDIIGSAQNNTASGDFSVNVGLGYKIENGAIVGRVKNCMVSGNIFDMLKNKVVAISKDIKERGNYYTPNILFKDVIVHSK
jgi:PmbA protein